MNPLEELGYHLNFEAFSREFQDYTNKNITPGIKNWLEGAAPYMVMAYNAGCDGRKLTDLFSFLEATT